MPPIPEGKGSPVRQARRRDMWRSVLTQQLQADMLACDMSSQLLNIAPDPEAKLYYSTMVQDESRHTEAWLKLIEEAGGTAERDPYLDELAHMTLEADTLEEKVFQMQVFYERLIISRFRLIARASRGTVLEDLCNRLTTDDGIHHGAGMAYEKVLLTNADKKTKRNLVEAANRLLPIFVQHALWRPAGARLHRRGDALARHREAEGGHRDRRPPGGVARPRRQRRRAALLLTLGGDADGRAAARRADPAPRSPRRSRELGEVGLATVQVGDDPASTIYIRRKHEAAADGGHATRPTSSCRRTSPRRSSTRPSPS